MGWEVMNRLHEKGYIGNPKSEAKLGSIAVHSTSFNPRGKRGFNMVNGYPKTPLFPRDGERGFVFGASFRASRKDVGIKAGISQKSQQCPGDP